MLRRRFTPSPFFLPMDAVKILGSLLSKNALGSKTGGGILESLLGGGDAPRGKAPSSAGNPADILSTLLGGKKSSGKGGFAALAAILAVAAASRGKGGGSSKGGGGDLLGSLLGEVVGKGGLGGLGDLLGGGETSRGKSGGGLGDLVGGLLGGGKSGGSPDLGGLLGSLLGGGDAARAGIASLPEIDPAEAEEGAKLLIEAMCLAAKSDGHVDEQERETILGQLGDLDDDEIEFVKRQLSSSTGIDDFVRRVPEDMAEQVYAFALMAVRLDSREEAEWFAQLAQGLGIDGTAANAIHERLGQPEIFA